MATSQIAFLESLQLKVMPIWICSGGFVKLHQWSIFELTEDHETQYRWVLASKLLEYFQKELLLVALW